MRYHFHIIDGINLHDYRGTILADESQARVYADEMMAHVARAKRNERHQKFIKVTDADGAEVFRIPVPVAKAGRSGTTPKREPEH